MKKSMSKLIATVLAFLILLLPGTIAARERRGADILVTLKDGQKVSGELIAVKPESLLLLNPAGKDESIGLADIASIRIIKKRRPGRGALYGTLIGGAAAVVAGYVAVPNHEYRGLRAMYFGFVGAVVGGFVGLVSQSEGEVGKEIVIAGQSEARVNSSLAKLSRFARFGFRQ